jgi:hypothetical protein
MHFSYRKLGHKQAEVMKLNLQPTSHTSALCVVMWKDDEYFLLAPDSCNLHENLKETVCERLSLSKHFINNFEICKTYQKYVS